MFAKSGQLWVPGLAMPIGRAPAVVVAGSWPALPVTSGLIARYNAAISVTTSGANVTAWPDISGNGNHLATVTGTNPTFSATGFNGKPGIVFGGAGALSCDPFSGWIDEGCTIIVVGNIGSGSAANSGIVTYGEGAGNDFNGSGNYAFMTHSTDAVASTSVDNGGYSSALTDAANHWFALRSETDTETGNRSHWVDGTERTPGTRDFTNLTDAGTLVVGSRYISGAVSSDYLTGAIGEILVVNVPWTDTNLSTDIPGYTADANGWGL